MADAYVGTCVTSCDHSVAGADKGNFKTDRDTSDNALRRDVRRRVFARAIHMPSQFDFYAGCSEVGRTTGRTTYDISISRRRPGRAI